MDKRIKNLERELDISTNLYKRYEENLTNLRKEYETQNQ